MRHRAAQVADGVTCPFCGSARTVLLAPFASSLLTSQHRCLACRSYFEAVRRPAAARGGAR